LRWVTLLCHAFPPWCFCLAIGLRARKPANDRTKPLKLWAQINLPFFL
jgi:hypothetical protein